MKKEDVIPYFLGRGEAKPTTKTNLWLACGIMCYLWVVYCVGLMVGDLVSLPFNWYSAYAEASEAEANKVKIETSIKEMEFAQQQFHELLKQQPWLKKCIRLYKQIQSVGGIAIPCKIEPVERVHTSSGTIVPAKSKDAPKAVLLPTVVETVKAETIPTYRSAANGDVLYAPFKGWRTNKNGYTKTFIELKGSKKEDRMWDLLDRYGLGNNYWDFITVGKRYGIKPEVIVCIAWADSDLGRALKTKNNIGNVGNTDSGKTRSFPTLEAGISAIWETLNNWYLWHKQAIGSLTPSGGGDPAYYASEGFPYKDPSGNWNANVLNCINMIHGKVVADENFLFRN